MSIQRRGLATGGMMLIGESYWRREPLDQAAVDGCHATSKDEWLALPELIESFGGLGCDVVEMVFGRPGQLGSVRRAAVA
jgi:hypothetical protein